MQERRQIALQPPILYAVSKSGLLLSASRDAIKLKTTKGEFKQALLGDNPEGEDYVKQYTFFFRHKEKMGVEENLKKATKLVASTAPSLRKLLNVPKKEKDEAKATRLTEVKVAKEKLAKPRSKKAPKQALLINSSKNYLPMTRKVNGTA